MDEKQVKTAFRESILFRKQSLSNFEEKLAVKTFAEASKILAGLEVANVEALKESVIAGNISVDALTEALSEEEPAADPETNTESAPETPVDGAPEETVTESAEPAKPDAPAEGTDKESAEPAKPDAPAEGTDKESAEPEADKKPTLEERVSVLEKTSDNEVVTLTESPEDTSDNSVVEEEESEEDKETSTEAVDKGSQTAAEKDKSKDDKSKEDSDKEAAADADLSDDEMPAAPTVAENANVTSESLAEAVDKDDDDDSDMTGDELKELFVGKKNKA